MEVRDGPFEINGHERSGPHGGHEFANVTALSVTSIRPAPDGVRLGGVQLPAGAPGRYRDGEIFDAPLAEGIG